MIFFLNIPRFLSILCMNKIPNNHCLAPVLLRFTRQIGVSL